MCFAFSPGRLASIRPRLGRRGDVIDDSPLSSRYTELQFGHGSVAVETSTTSQHCSLRTSRFNSATARSPWRRGYRNTYLACCGALQFGHGSVAVETHDPSSPGNGIRCASIRPRLGRRGDRAGRASRLTCVNGASIRPRLGRRGDPRRRTYLIPSSQASIRPRLGRRGDRRCSPRTWRAGTGFNSATARSPWRPSRGGGGWDGSGVLQFGHGSVAVETRMHF